MLKKLILKNWKSFRYAELPIDPLTILIGANASGKSNVVEALDFLEHLARGELLSNIFAGDTTAIRGSANQIAMKSESAFTLEVILQPIDIPLNYRYSCVVEVTPELGLTSESLSTWPCLNHENTLEYYSDPVKEQTVNGYVKTTTSAQEGKVRKIGPIGPPADASWLNNFSLMTWDKELSKQAGEIVLQLRKIKLLNPNPSKMRGYSRVSNELSRDAANIAGFLSSFPHDEKQRIEDLLTSYVAELSTQDVSRIWTETVGRASTDAMLYGEEFWGESTFEIDARSMSDGTLRFVAILTALLTSEIGSQLIVEDVDDGLHPSRAQLLLKALREIGEQRQVDVLVTTHNPALLDSLEQDYLPFIVVAYRDSRTGESLLTPLDKMENLPKLLASASLGDLVTQGAIERNIGTEAIAP